MKMRDQDRETGVDVADHLFRAQRNGLVNSAFDRITHKRDDLEWVAQHLIDPSTRFVPVWKQKNLINTEKLKASILSQQDIARPETLVESTVLLGSHEERAYFAYYIDGERDPIHENLFRTDATFEDLRRLGPMLDDWDASLLAYAKGICYWHERHRFCGACGSPTVNSKAGHLRMCSNSICAAPHFPRTDPAIIVLVHCGERCLLGRQPRWPKTVYSTLAGFVEPGESAEQAVLREVWEETGVRIEEMLYQSSQPWPFPGSLMLGFQATAKFKEIRRNDNELEDARWFTREQVIDAVADRGPLKLPPAFSVSRRLIEDWCTETN
jgi:NAD+ diphosphatase